MRVREKQDLKNIILSREKELTVVEVLELESPSKKFDVSS